MISWKIKNYFVLLKIIGCDFLLSANIISLCHGLAIGWLSPNLPKLQSEDSPLIGGPMTLSQTSWIGSYFSIGAIVGNCIFGILSNYIGRKNTLCILALPNLVNIAMWSGCLFVCEYDIELQSKDELTHFGFEFKIHSFGTWQHAKNGNVCREKIFFVLMQSDCVFCFGAMKTRSSHVKTLKEFFFHFHINDRDQI